MNELSLHILDICQNSIKADATIVEIVINEDITNDSYEITIKDDGKGMNKKTLSEVSDPFFTTRTTRKVGLGISLFKMAAELSDGGLAIHSEIGIGTEVTVDFVHSHINRAPLGLIEDSISILCLNEKGIDIVYKHYYNKKEFIFDTREVKAVLDGIPFTDYNVIVWIKNNIKDGLKSIQKEEKQWNL